MKKFDKRNAIDLNESDIIIVEENERDPNQDNIIEVEAEEVPPKIRRVVVISDLVTNYGINFSYGNKTNFTF